MVKEDKKSPDSLTREQYRQLKQQQETEFKQRDKKRVEVERQYARTHHQPEVGQNPEAVVTDDFKTPRWRKMNRRLNWIIGILIFLLVVVFLILFFVN